MMTEATKPKEPSSAPQKEVSEVPKPEEGSSKEAGPESAELAEKLKSMESELGRFKQELGDERKKVEELNPYKLHYEQQQRQPKQETQQLSQEEQMKQANEQWFDNPAQMANQRDAKMMYYQAQQNAPIAMKMAKLENPEAFVGISDQEVKQAVEGGVQAGFTNPGSLGDPNSYIGAAWILRGQKSGFKPTDAPPQGLATTESETPTGSPPSTEDEIPALQGDALTQKLLEYAAKEGVTKEQMEKKIHDRRQREGR
jgi:hypothetical protein